MIPLDADQRRIRELERKVLALTTERDKLGRQKAALEFALKDVKRHLLEAEKKTFKLRRENRP